MKKIIIGCDHGGFEYKNIITEYLKANEYEVIDVGTYTKTSCDYPDIASKLAKHVIKENALGILICGTGIGIGIAANKCKGIRAALCHDVFSAKMSRAHNDSNVLTLGQRVIGEGLMLEIVETWLNASFEGDRHLTRVNKISNLEEQ